MTNRQVISKEPSNNKIKKFPISREWEKNLTFNDKGNIAKTIDNFYLILTNAEEFIGKIKLNDMSDKIEYKGKCIETTDFDEMQLIIEKEYGIYDDKKFNSALRLVARENMYNSIKDMLESLKWDGIKRADTILCKYLNAEESEYTATCFRLLLFGAIERVYNPGAKYDYLIIFKGGQGIGKSTFFNMLCGNEYYQDNLKDFKKAFEYTQGKWFVEIGELDAMKKAEITAMKSYVTQTKETHRLPYDKTSKDFYRKFVLLGTTNENCFFEDETGNRRYPVIECAKHKNQLSHSIFEEGALYEIKQALAEVFQEYKDGKKFLTLPKEMEAILEERNKQYLSDDGLSGIVEGYLENKEKVCIMQIWDECVEQHKKWKYSRTMANRIRDIILRLPDWERYNGSKSGKTDITSVVRDYHGNLITKHYDKQVAFVKNKKVTVEKNNFIQASNENMNKIFNTENENYFMEV